MLVKISHLDNLLNLVGEVIITSNNLHNANRRVQGFQERKEPLDKVVVDMLKAAEQSGGRISSDLHGLVMDIRMVEIKQTFQRFRRSVRDMAKESGKQVEFITIGEDTLVDKTIAEKLYDPLNHQIRNAIDHGLENALERQRRSKNATGRLTLKAYERENNVYIEIKDDGQGLDPEVVAQSALLRGIVSAEEVSAMTDSEKIELIFRAGLSTKTSASKISGRGVGMDVVRTNIEELGGEIYIESKIGEGTVFTYRIPQLTAVNIVDCLTVKVGSHFFAIPILNVVSTLGMSSDKIITTFKRGRSIKYLGEIVTLFDMSALLGHGVLPPEDEVTIVIVDAKNGRIALLVTEVLSPEKLVFSPLPDLFRVQGVSGATLITGSYMGLVVDVSEMVDRSKGTSNKEKIDDEKVGKEAKDSVSGTDIIESGPASLEKGGEPVDSDSGEIILPHDGFEQTSEFLMELDEMIKDADEQILSLEDNPGDPEIINRIFRYFHSMKGNLMMVGLSELGNVIHDVEAILDRVRSDNLEIDTGIIDILLDSTTLIKGVKLAIANNQKPSIDNTLLEMVEKYQKPKATGVEETDPTSIHDRTFELGALERFNLMANRYSGQNVFQAYLSVQPKFQEPFLVALLILKRMARIGHVFGSVPRVEEIENQNMGEELKVMFSTSFDHDQLKHFIENYLVKHYDVEDFEILEV